MSGDGADVLNPVAVEQSIQGLTQQIAKGVRVVSEAHKSKLDADRAYDLAYASAYLAADGPSHEKRYRAETVTQQQRADRDVAEVAYQHAQRQMRALEGQLSAFQTIAKSVTQMYGASGSGRGQ